MPASTSREAEHAGTRRRPGAIVCGLLATLTAWAGQGPMEITMPPGLERRWLPLAQDGIHDPEAPAVRLGLLQQPAEALTELAPDYAGNQVRWALALLRGEIEPLHRLQPDTKVETKDLDLLLSLRGGMPPVHFSHAIHGEWLACSNCHDQLFKEELGATRLSMFEILDGRQCGVCHGTVAFPLTECARCHSAPRLPGEPGETVTRP